ncbi:DoxX family protein [Sphaerimonospora thailandensis]|uniref:DoxX-like protein n=1 Tax=Sphaerimonospora thailandensis TaxID=795644 RepID=A0A8J3R2F4_9ACTN|nr:DoxX family protein [Sphaerimonospora thailandensis]GIH67792.1 hypothetical protein Mth01_00450 [Sphaerimonospora thailandensis]
MNPTPTTAPPVAPTRGRALNITLWVFQVLLALQFAFSGVLKLTGSTDMVQMFADIGAGQWFRYLVGVLEIAGAVGLLVRRLTGLAAIGLACLMVGAVITQVAVLGGVPGIEIGFLLVSAFIAWGRFPQTRALLGGSAK